MISYAINNNWLCVSWCLSMLSYNNIFVSLMKIQIVCLFPLFLITNNYNNNNYYNQQQQTMLRVASYF